MYNCYYKMGIVDSSSLTIKNEDNNVTQTYDLGEGSYPSQMKQIAGLIKDYDVSTIYVSNEYAIPLENILNEILIKDYAAQPTHHINFVYRKV